MKCASGVRISVGDSVPFLRINLFRYLWLSAKEANPIRKVFILLVRVLFKMIPILLVQSLCTY